MQDDTSYDYRADPILVSYLMVRGTGHRRAPVCIAEQPVSVRSCYVSRKKVDLIANHL
jgi:hypothetical protein